MENKEFKFKTNIKCGSCVSKVTPFLNFAKGIKEWSVDTTNPDKVLTISSEGITESEVIEAVNKAGYKAKVLE